MMMMMMMMMTMMMMMMMVCYAMPMQMHGYAWLYSAMPIWLGEPLAGSRGKPWGRGRGPSLP
eukprot:9379575-Karenia_brevis.AAC.1